MFTYDTIEETKEYLEKLFHAKILPSYSNLPDNTNLSRIFICFTFSKQWITHIIQSKIGETISPKILDENISYIELDFHNELIHPKREPPIYEFSEESRTMIKSKCTNLIRLFREEYNIPFFYIRLDVRCGKPFLFDHPNIGIAEETFPGFFYRPDLDFAPRSSWEANLARVLNFKNIHFQYEHEAISISSKYNNSEVPGMYIPDFVLDDGSVIEVKGFWDAHSREKCAFFSKTYPNRPYYILDPDFYISLSKLYSSSIPGWEHEKILKPHENDLQIVGLGFGSRKETVKKLKPGQSVKLMRDKNNRFDKNAILVLTDSNEEIGFISSDWACIYATKIDMGMTFFTTIVDIQAKKIDIKVIRSNPEEAILWDFLR